MQLPEAGAWTDVQANLVLVPPWATQALFVLSYETSPDAPDPSLPYAVGAVYIGVTPTSPLVFFAGLSTIQAGSRAAVINDIGCAARIGATFEEDGDQTFPGKISVQIVFR